jgi:hypothetical protein
MGVVLLPTLVVRPYLIIPLQAGYLSKFAAQVGIGLVFVPVLPRVSYRRRDWLLIGLVPYWCFVVAAIAGWRLANLPVRDWAPRPDEVQAGPTAPSQAQAQVPSSPSPVAERVAMSNRAVDSPP